MIEMLATTSGERIVKILGVVGFLADVVLIFVTPEAFGKWSNLTTAHIFSTGGPNKSRGSFPLWLKYHKVELGDLTSSSHGIFVCKFVRATNPQRRMVPLKTRQGKWGKNWRQKTGRTLNLSKVDSSWVTKKLLNVRYVGCFVGIIIVV